MSAAAPAAPALRRELGFWDCTFLVVGIVIGSGIFMTTGVMAASVMSPALLLAVWGVGGLLTLAGALAIAELGAALPEAGGPYVYLRALPIGELAGVTRVAEKAGGSRFGAGAGG